MEIKPTELVFVETSTQTYSLSGEGFGYNYGRLKSSACHASRENTLLICGKIQKCRRHLQRRFGDGRTDGAYLGGWRCVGHVHSVVYNASAVTRGADHMLSEMSPKWYHVVDLDWPLNASRRLSASAELLVVITLLSDNVWRSVLLHSARAVGLVTSTSALRP